jgi:hypothetical protein
MSRILFVCAFASLLAAPVFGQASLNATPVGPFEALADCTGFDIYQEPFDDANFGTARTSDSEAGFRVFENFFGAAAAGTATAIRTWGIEIDFNSPTLTCAVDDTAPFDVAFWGGNITPDLFNQISSENNIACGETNTGAPFGSFGNVVQVDCALTNLNVNGARWASVQRTNDADSCFWLWVDEQLLGTYDDQAYQEGAGGFVTADQPFCLGGSGGDGGDGGDGGVPATTGIGVALMILLVGGSGGYFLRRKENSNRQS